MAWRELGSAVDYETDLLGCFVVAVDGIEALWDQVQETDFFDRKKASLFGLLRKMHAEGKPVDLLTVWDQVIATGKPSDYPSSFEVAALGDLVHKKAPAQHYLNRLRERSCLRRFSEMIESVQKHCQVPGADFGAIVREVQESVSTLVHEQVVLSDQGKTDFDAATSLLATLESRSETRIFTDIVPLDDLTGGFLPGELVVVTADTGVGKTLLAQQMKRRACKDGYRTLYCSAEMSAEHLVSRSIAAEAQVPTGKMRKPETITKAEWDRLVKVAAHSCRKCRILDGPLDVARIKGAAHEMATKEKLGLIILDYDELIDAPGDTETERLTALILSAKTLAVETGSIVLLVSQLRKATSEDVKRPALARLYGSGAKSKHANAIIHVDRPYVRNLKGDETEAAIHVLKFRDGKVGYIPCTFNIRLLRFEGKSGIEKPREDGLPYKDN